MNTSQLLQAYLDGMLTHAEEKQLRSLLSELPARTAEEEAVLMLLLSPSILPNPDADWWSEEGCQEYDRIVTNSNLAATRTTHHRTLHILLRIAACLIGFCVLTFGGWWFASIPSTDKQSVTSVTLPPPKLQLLTPKHTLIPTVQLTEVRSAHSTTRVPISRIATRSKRLPDTYIEDSLPELLPLTPVEAEALLAPTFDALLDAEYLRTQQVEQLTDLQLELEYKLYLQEQSQDDAGALCINL